MSLPFIAIGFGGLYGALTGKTLPAGSVQRLARLRQRHAEILESHASSLMTCPQCSAPIGAAEISPSGDVKCLHCQNWYNVRSR
jgi:ribosomal protein S27E